MYLHGERIMFDKIIIVIGIKGIGENFSLVIYAKNLLIKTLMTLKTVIGLNRLRIN